MTGVECSICDSAFGEIAVGLVEWADGLAPLGRRFDNVPRCRDRAGCRQRVEAAKKPWPLAPTSSDPRPAPPDPDPMPEDPPVVENPVTGWHAYAPTEEELDLLDEARPW